MWGWELDARDGISWTWLAQERLLRPPAVELRSVAEHYDMRMVDGVFDGAVDGGVSSVVATHTTGCLPFFPVAGPMMMDLRSDFPDAGDEQDALGR